MYVCVSTLARVRKTPYLSGLPSQFVASNVYCGPLGGGVNCVGGYKGGGGGYKMPNKPLQNNKSHDALLTKENGVNISGK